MYFHFNLQFDVFRTICEKSRLVGDKNFFVASALGKNVGTNLIKVGSVEEI